MKYFCLLFLLLGCTSSDSSDVSDSNGNSSIWRDCSIFETEPNDSLETAPYVGHMEIPDRIIICGDADQDLDCFWFTPSNNINSNFVLTTERETPAAILLYRVDFLNPDDEYGYVFELVGVFWGDPGLNVILDYPLPFSSFGYIVVVDGLIGSSEYKLEIWAS